MAFYQTGWQPPAARRRQLKATLMRNSEDVCRGPPEIALSGPASLLSGESFTPGRRRRRLLMERADLRK